MWKKTVLKQIAKLIPKNEAILHAIAEDNKDGNVDERIAKAKVEAESLKMGSLLKLNKPQNEENKKGADRDVAAESDSIPGPA
jgi:hypothetical protein